MLVLGSRLSTVYSRTVASSYSCRRAGARARARKNAWRGLWHIVAFWLLALLRSECPCPNGKAASANGLGQARVSSRRQTAIFVHLFARGEGLCGAGARSLRSTHGLGAAPEAVHQSPDPGGRWLCQPRGWWGAGMACAPLTAACGGAQIWAPRRAASVIVRGVAPRAPCSSSGTMPSLSSPPHQVLPLVLCTLSPVTMV